MKFLIIIMLCILLSGLVNAQVVSQEVYEIDNPSRSVVPLSSSDLISAFQKVNKIPKTINYTHFFVVDNVLYKESSCVSVLGVYNAEMTGYSCEGVLPVRDCPAGLSGGKGTRCYDYDGQKWWDASYCKEGWVLQ